MTSELVPLDRRRVRWKLAAAIGWLIAVLGPIATMRESFWVDELHSAWVIAGPWHEVADRASQGNQSPLYFGVLKAWSVLAGSLMSDGNPNEWTLRLSSLLGWVVLNALVFISIPRTVSHRHVALAIGFVASSLALDRIGAFYAIELRPYVWVAAISFVMMQCGARLVERPSRFGWSWTLTAAIVFYLHYTGMLIVALSWTGIVAGLASQWSMLPRQDRNAILGYRCSEAIVLGCIAAPGLVHFSRIADRSQQWVTFAGNASLVQAVDLLPWLFWCAIPAVVVCLQGVLRKRTELAQLQNVSVRDNTAWLLQLVLVSLGSVLGVWLLTALHVAPLMHRRYIFGAYPAVILLGASALSQIRKPGLVVATGVAATCLMLSWQGTFDQWRAGRWLAWQRQEDWRAAVAFLNGHSQADDLIYLAPMLIETRGDAIDPSLDRRYLAYPVSGMYMLYKADAVQLLPNVSHVWPREIDRAWHSSSAGTAWVVARVSNPRSLEEVYENAMSSTKSFGTIDTKNVFSGGRIQVWRLERR